MKLLSRHTTIDVDGIPVKVKTKNYAADPIKTEAEVRDAREREVGDLSDLYDEFPDYDTLEAIAAHEAGL